PGGAARRRRSFDIVDGRLPGVARLAEDVVGPGAARRRRIAVVDGPGLARPRDLTGVLRETVLVRVGLGPVREIAAALTEGVQVRHPGAEAHANVAPRAVL